MNPIESSFESSNAPNDFPDLLKSLRDLPDDFSDLPRLSEISQESPRSSKTLRSSTSLRNIPEILLRDWWDSSARSLGRCQQVLRVYFLRFTLHFHAPRRLTPLAKMWKDCGKEFKDFEYEYEGEPCCVKTTTMKRITGIPVKNVINDIECTKWSYEEYYESSGDVSTASSVDVQQRKKRDAHVPAPKRRPGQRSLSKGEKVKLKKPKRTNLIKENRWAKRNHGKKTDEMRRLGVEKALPKPDPERGVFLDFGDFTERNEHLFLENPARTPHQRTKRENKDDQKESVKLTMAEVDAIRTKCSKFYKYLKHLKMEETAGKESSVKISFDEEENCPVADYKEDVSYNPLCQLEVFCDKFGCYDYNLDSEYCNYGERLYAFVAVLYEGFFIPK
nr:uncharacterized protein LOC113815736 [Penaeus vannamei]